MQKSSRRTRFGWWFLLVWAIAVLAMIAVSALRREEPPRYDAATLVQAQARWSHG